MQVRDVLRARRPYKVSTILEIGDALANAQKAAIQLQDERDEARAYEKQLCDSLNLLRSEQSKLLVERDQARAEATKLSTDLWARKPLEDRVTSLTDEVAQLQLERQEQIDRYNAEVVNALQVSEQLTEAKAALKSAQRARDELQLQVDELRAGLMGVVSAQHVYSMLEDMLDQTEWVGQCLDSSTYEQMSCIQRTISVIAERVNDMGKEATSAND